MHGILDTLAWETPRGDNNGEVFKLEVSGVNPIKLALSFGNLKDSFNQCQRSLHQGLTFKVYSKKVFNQIIFRVWNVLDTRHYLKKI